MEGINTTAKYHSVINDIDYAHEDDKKVVRQIIALFEEEKATVCRAKIIMKLTYDLLDVQSYVTTEVSEDENLDS